MKVETFIAACQAIYSMQMPLQHVLLETKDSFFLEECVERYVVAWKKLLGENSLVTRLSSQELYALRDDLQNFPSLFGTKKLWVVAWNSGKQKKDNDFVRIIQSASSENFFLLFAEEGLPKELITDAQQDGLSIVIPAPKPWERVPFLIQWVQGYCQKQKKGIEKEAATLLANSYLDNRHGLVNELEKLILYRWNESTISLRDVEGLSCLVDHVTMWQLLDALLLGDKKGVVQALSSADDWSEIALLRFLKGQLEKLVIAFEEKGVPKNKSQERQIAHVGRRGVASVMSWVTKIEQKEIGIRSGIEEGSISSLLPFFVSLM